MKKERKRERLRHSRVIKANTSKVQKWRSVSPSCFIWKQRSLSKIQALTSPFTDVVNKGPKGQPLKN